MKGNGRAERRGGVVWAGGGRNGLVGEQGGIGKTVTRDNAAQRIRKGGARSGG